MDPIVPVHVAPATERKTEPGGFARTLESVAAGVLTTIEGNTNDGGSREGVGVFRRTGPNGRKISSVNKGFLDVAA